MKTMLLIFLMMSSLLVFAEEENCDPTPSSVRPLVAVANAVKTDNCNASINVAALCSSVSGKIKDKDKDKNGPYEYLYQRQIYESACVDIDNDSDDTISKKVNRFWNRNEANLTCDNTQFNVPNGSILKFAVAKVHSDFIADAIQTWKVNLNRIDPSDQSTLLDYVKKELERQKGSPNEKTLQHYYSELKKAGAKHKSEL